MLSFKQHVNENSYANLVDKVYRVFTDGPRGAKRNYEQIDGNTISFEPSSRSRLRGPLTLEFKIATDEFVVKDASGKVVVKGSDDQAMMELYTIVWGVSD